MRQSAENEPPTIERLGASSLVEGDGVVLDDEQLLDVWAQLRDVTRSWQGRINAELDPERRVTTLTLDFEFREMAPAWPALDPATAAGDDDGSAGGGGAGSRIVVKQARTLEPGLRAIPEVLTDLPIPADVLARTTRAERVSCPNQEADESGEPDVFVELFTDPLAAVDIGYSTEPLRVVESGSADRVVDDGCTTVELFVSANDYLQELFADRVAED